MTPDQQAEWDYRYWERIGMLCGDGRVTQEAINIAKREADEAVCSLRNLSPPNSHE